MEHEQGAGDRAARLPIVGGWTVEVWECGGWVFVGRYGTKPEAQNAANTLQLLGKKRIRKATRGGQR